MKLLLIPLVVALSIVILILSSEVNDLERQIRALSAFCVNGNYADGINWPQELAIDDTWGTQPTELWYSK